VAPASVRSFPPPDGDPWHPAFDLAATRLPALDLFEIAGGVVSVDTTGARPGFYVFDGDGRLIPDLSSGSDPFIVEPGRHEGLLALIDDWHAGFNVCHALFDKLTRLGAVRDLFADQPITALTFTEAPWYGQALAALGCGHLRPTAARWSIKADRLVMLSNHRRGAVMHPAFSAAPHALSLIEQNFQARTPGDRRLYIARTDSVIRNIVNEAEVQALFVAHGFEVHALSGLTFAEQQALFQQASHVAGIHGAGLTNLAFSHPSTRVLEMMPPTTGTFAYWLMAGALGMSYQLLTIEDAWLDTGSGASLDLMLHKRDCRVDMGRLEAALARLLAPV
jgi:hypothetical protein